MVYGGVLRGIPPRVMRDGLVGYAQGFGHGVNRTVVLLIALEISRMASEGNFRGFFACINA